MIREIINFTENLIADIPEVMQWKTQPDKGLHVFIDIDESGEWINQNLKQGTDYDYFDGKNQNIPMWKDCIRYQDATCYITMNKVQKFDTKQKIHSCSPFAIAFNFNFNDSDKDALGIKVFKKGYKPTDEEKKENDVLIREKRYKVVCDRLNDYKTNALNIFGIDLNKSNCDLDLFSNAEESFMFSKQLNGFYNALNDIMTKIQNLDEYKLLTNKDYLRINLRSIPIEEQEKLHNNYIKSEIFNGEQLKDTDFGAVGFFTGYNGKKFFYDIKQVF